MKALLLNSGMGRRMGHLTSHSPKCMTELTAGQTILSRQLSQLSAAGIREVVITTGPFEKQMREYAASLGLPVDIVYINNPICDRTNYIYSIYLARHHLADDLILLHGDLVFDGQLLGEMLQCPESCMTVSTTLPLPKKDFKAIMWGRQIEKVGVAFFDHAVTAQPLYKLNQQDWSLWLESITGFCEQGEVNCYAEDAFNRISDRCKIMGFDIRDRLCQEIDTVEDLARIREKMGDYR